MPDGVIVEHDGSVAIVRLNRPDVGNAVSVEMLDELALATRELDADEAVWAIVLTGAGRVFCAGTDLSNAAETWSDQTEWNSEPINLRGLATPVLAAVNGAAVGAGIALAVACDIRIVAADAKLGFVFVRRGIIADNDLHWWLPRLVGTSRAIDLLMTGRIFSGTEAVEYGLATRAVPSEEVLSTTLELAHDMVDNCAPLSLAVTKALTYRILAEPDLARAHEAEWKAFTWMGAGPDATEGATSFMQRRPLVWISPKSAVTDLE